MKLARLLRIIVILMNRKGVTVKFLAEEFEVSKKTIYRDLETLIIAGIPVQYGEDNSGIIRIMEGYSLKYAILPTKDDKTGIFDLSKLPDEVMSIDEINDRQETWHTFMTQKQFDFDSIKNEILHSWTRCKRDKISLYHVPSDYIVKPSDMKNFIIENLPEYKEEGFKLFNHIIKNLNLNIVICDNRGNLKYVFNENEEFTNMYPKIGYLKNCFEDKIGTNASSLAISESKPIKVIGPEHYNKIFHEYSGVTSPFYQNGELVGIVSTFFLHTSVTNHTLNVVHGLARLYESLILHKTDDINESERPEENIIEKSPLKEHSLSPNLVGASQLWKSVISAADCLASSESHFLIKGEEGVGKKSLSEYIHHKSPRKDGPYLVFDCQSIPKELQKISLLGYKDSHGNHKRIGVIENSIGGTLMLANIECLSLELQKKVYTFLKSHKLKRISSNKMEIYDVRVIIGTTLSDLNSLYKPLAEILSVLQICIPPLRDRREDIPVMVREYINSTELPLKFKAKLAATLIKKLQSEKWNGNARELFNKVSKLLVLDLEVENYLEEKIN